MNQSIPRELRIALWVIGGVLAVLAVVNGVLLLSDGSDNWWISISLLVSSGVCLTIAAVNTKR